MKMQFCVYCKVGYGDKTAMQKAELDCPSNKEREGAAKMEKRHISYKNKIYISYLTSYLIIGIIPLLLSLAGLKICENTVVEEIKTAQSAALLQVQEIYDRNLASMKKAGQILAGNEYVVSLGEKETYTAQDHLEMQKVSDEMTLWMDKVDVCTNMSVYFLKSGCFVCQDGVYPKELWALFRDRKCIREKELGELTDARGVSGYFVGQNQAGEQVLYFYENVYSFNLKEKQAVVILELKWEQVKALCSFSDKATIFWQNEEGTTLWVTEGNGELSAVDYRGDSALEGELLYSGSGKNRLISSYRKAEEYDWKYGISMKEKDYFADVERMKGIILAQLLVLVLCAVLLAFYYSRQRYIPVKRILEAVRKNQRSQKEVQALFEVEKYLDNLCRENKKLTADRKRIQQNAAGEILSGYMKGWNQDKAMVEELLLQNQLEQEDGYMVFLIVLRDINACKLFREETENTAADKKEDRELLQFVFQNIFEEMVLQSCKGLLLQMDGNFLFLANLEGEGPEKVCEALKKCSGAYGDYLNLNLFIGGSGRHDQLEELPRAYNEAMQILTYQTFWGNQADQVLLYDTEYQKEEDWTMEGMFGEEQRKLYNLMLAGQYGDAEALLNEIMDRMFVKDVRYTRRNQYRLMGLLNMVCMMFEDMLGKKDEEFLKELKPMDRLLRAETVDDAKEIILTIFGQVVRHVEKDREEEKPRWVMETMEEIEKEYGDVNLSLSELAGRKGLNLAYMGRTFKQYTGCSIPDYIHKVRIRECKKLLKTGMSVKDAAEKVGYIDSKTLIRSFKKQEGITPGQYKTLMEEAR